MSYSWLDGRPFMYDNIWGFHHRIHNYYTVLLWGPLCYVAGAYGFFLVQALLLGLSYAVLNERLTREVPPWVRYGLLGAVLLAPVFFSFLFCPLPLVVSVSSEGKASHPSSFPE